MMLFFSHGKFIFVNFVSDNLDLRTFGNIRAQSITFSWGVCVWGGGRVGGGELIKKKLSNNFSPIVRF